MRNNSSLQQREPDTGTTTTTGEALSAHTTVEQQSEIQQQVHKGILTNNNSGYLHNPQQQ
jgi:hypothetical protein